MRTYTTKHGQVRPVYIADMSRWQRFCYRLVHGV
jgi:hypothetical protein